MAGTDGKYVTPVLLPSHFGTEKNARTRLGPSTGVESIRGQTPANLQETATCSPWRILGCRVNRFATGRLAFAQFLHGHAAAQFDAILLIDGDDFHFHCVSD